MKQWTRWRKAQMLELTATMTVSLLLHSWLSRPLEMADNGDKIRRY